MSRVLAKVKNSGQRESVEPYRAFNYKYLDGGTKRVILKNVIEVPSTPNMMILRMILIIWLS